MYSFIEGRLAEKNPTYAVIDCHGVGYYLHISLNTFSQIKDQEKCRLLTHLVVREDAMMLYGFFEERERSLFRSLITVNGVGVNTARIILSSMSPDEVYQSIVGEDANALKRVKGIGAKTAQRIILDLKDKLGKDVLPTGEKVPLKDNTGRDEALQGLIVLGFPKSAAEKAIDKVLSASNQTLKVEDLIKNALKIL